MGDPRRRTATIAVASLAVLAACGGTSPSTSAPTFGTVVVPIATNAPAITASANDPATTIAVPATTGAPETAPSTDEAVDDVCPPGTFTTSGTVFHVFFEDVKFPAGSSGTTITDEVCPDMTNAYDFVASAGQRLTLTLTSEASAVELWGPDGSVLGSTDGSLVVDPLPEIGRYSLVLTTTAETPDDFSLAVEVTPSESTVAAASVPAVPSSVPPAEACRRYVEFTTYPMKLCHRGEQVAQVQELLIALGHDIEADGFFGPATAAALAEEFDDGVSEIRQPSDLEQLRPDPD